jgi:alpha-mannosidase
MSDSANRNAAEPVPEHIVTMLTRRVVSALFGAAKVRLVVLALGVMGASVPLASAAATETIWQIGTFNDSSFEFHGKIDYSKPSTDFVYVVGKSDPENDWVAAQPASESGKSGFEAHPLRIKFDLKKVSSGLYSMRIALLTRALRVPWLQVEINGHVGWFYQHPTPTYTAGAADAAHLPTSASSTIQFGVPTNVLRQVTNELVLTVLDEPSPSTYSTYKSYRYGKSQVEYDALAMEYDAGGNYSSSDITVNTIPTVFWKQSGGQLTEVMDVFIRVGGRPALSDFTFILGDQRYVKKLGPLHDFGEYLVKVEVPKFSDGAHGAVVLRDKGHLRRLRTGPLTPAKQWNILIVPFSHLDIGYTDYQAKTAEVHARILDDVIQAIQDRPDFRFCPDGFWAFEQFWDSRSESQRQKLLQLVREKKISVPAQYANILTGFASLEALIRSFYPSHRFSAEHGLEAPTYAAITDVPSYSWSYASVLAAARLKYFVAGSDNYRAPVLYFDRLHEKSPFWWEGPDGSRMLMWYSRMYSQLQEVFGLPPQVAIGREALPLFLQNYASPAYKPSSVLLYGTQGDNVGFFPQQISLVDDWNKEFAYPHLQFSGVQQAMEQIIAEAGHRAPIVRGDGGPYWEDGVASDAFFTAVDRSNERRILSAEKLSTIGSLIDPRIQLEPESFRKVWKDTLLYDEHTYGIRGEATSPDTNQHVRQQEVKEGFAAEGKRLSEHLLLRAESAIENFIPTEEGTLVVFNSLNWVRSGLVDVDLEKDKELWDLSTNQRVQFEVLVEGGAFQHVRFFAANVPPMGYKCYAKRPGGSASIAHDPLAAAQATMESANYKITLDVETGSVRSIVDKELNKELVDTVNPYRFNQYLYVTGADQRPNSLTDSRINMQPPTLQAHAAKSGRLLSLAKTPFGTVARLESSDLNTPAVQTEIILFDTEKKIEFINRVRKDMVYQKEAVYFAFPFALTQPRFKYAIQNGVVDPEADQIPGAGKEWFSVQHWVSVEQPNMSVTLVPIDAPLISLGDIVRGTWPREFKDRTGTVFSCVMNNYWPTNYVGAQGGDLTFRYVLTSDDRPTSSARSRLGLQEMTPLEANEISVVDKSDNLPRPLDGASGSFLAVDQPAVAVVAWKRAEDGKGTILRLLETEGKSTRVNINIPIIGLRSAWKTSALEDNQEPIHVSPHSVETEIGPFQILTLRLEGVSTSLVNGHQ